MNRGHSNLETIGSWFQTNIPGIGHVRHVGDDDIRQPSFPVAFFFFFFSAST